MVPVKALDVLIDAVEILRDEQVAIRLHLIGDGPLRKQLQRDVERRRMAEQVHFVGDVGHDRLADWYRAVDLTVLSSDSEGIPNVLRESLACGTPFVSTDVGSIHEFARSEYSTLVPPRNPAALAGAILSMLSPEYGRQAARHHPRTWRTCADETARLLQQLINQRREPERSYQRNREERVRVPAT